MKRRVINMAIILLLVLLVILLFTMVAFGTMFKLLSVLIIDFISILFKGDGKFFHYDGFWMRRK